MLGPSAWMFQVSNNNQIYVSTLLITLTVSPKRNCALNSRLSICQWESCDPHSSIDYKSLAETIV